MRNRGIGKLRGGGVQNLAALISATFGSARMAWWFTALDITSLGQTSAGTGTITSGDPVGYIADKSGNARHATQATSGNRPALGIDANGKYHLSYSGTTSLGLATGNIDLSAATKLTIFVAATNTTASGTKILLRLNAGTAQGMVDMRGASENFQVGLHGTADANLQRIAGVATNATQVLRLALDFGGATATDQVKPYRNSDPNGWTVTAAGPAGGTNFGNAPLFIGNWNPGTFNFAWVGRIYATLAVVGAITDSETALIEKYLASVCGVPYPFAYDPFTFSDTRTTSYETTGDYVVPSSLAQAHFTTSAETATVNFYGDTGLDGLDDAIGVFVNGVYNQQIGASIIGSDTATISLPPGNKTVTFVNSEWYDNGVGTPLGTFIKSITMGAKTNVVTTPVNRHVFYGDSITGGGAASPIHQYGLPTLLRKATTKSVAFEQASGRSLRSDCVDASARTVFVAKIVDLNPSVLWIAMGVNDYGQALWNAANFGTAYAAMLDALHTALPSMAIYCQSPIVRSVETANALGSTLGDYRTQVQTASNARVWTTFVDGSTILTTADLADGTHPTNAGNATYAASIVSRLGW